MSEIDLLKQLIEEIKRVNGNLEEISESLDTIKSRVELLEDMHARLASLETALMTRVQE